MKKTKFGSELGKKNSQEGSIEESSLDTMPDAKGRASTRTSSQTFTIPVVRRSFHSVALVALVAFSLPRACRLDGRAPPPPAGQGLGGLEGIEARERKEASPIDWQGLVGDNLVDDLSTPEWLSRMVMHMPASSLVVLNVN